MVDDVPGPDDGAAYRGKRRKLKEAEVGSGHEHDAEPAAPDGAGGEESLPADSRARDAGPNGPEDVREDLARDRPDAADDDGGVGQPGVEVDVAPGELVPDDVPDDPGDKPEEGELVEEAQRLAPLILAQIQNHLHLPMQMPDGAALAELKRHDPDAHKMWLRNVEKQLDHQRFMEAAKYAMPLRVMQSAHRSMLLAVLGGFILMGFVAYLGIGWLASVIGALDLGGVATVFASIVRARNQPDGE